MSLQRLLWPAGGIAVAVSFANTTVYAAEEKTKMQTLYKPSELPLYGDPEPAMFELIESEGTRYTHAVSSARKQTWDFLDSIQGQIDNVTHKWSVAKAHTNESLTYIQEDAGLLPRTALITVAGLGGIVAGYRGGIMRKLFYGTVGTLAGASLCYPNEAVAIGRMGWHFTIDQAEQALGRNIPGLSYKEEESVKVETAESSQPGSDNKKATKTATVSKTSASLVDMGMSREEDNDMYTEHARK